MKTKNYSYLESIGSVGSGEVVHLVVEDDPSPVPLHLGPETVSTEWT